MKKRKLIFKIAIVIIIIVLAFSAGFRFAIRFNLSQSKNPYCLEKIYYISVMMDKMDDDSYSEQLNKILKSVGYYFSRGKMTAIDEAAYICLLALINENESRISKKLDIFLERHTDIETGLLFEYSHDDLIDSKVDFTAEIISLFENENIGIDTSVYVDGMQSYIDETDFKAPEEGDSLFNSGGLALYGMYMANDSYDFSDFYGWFELWNDYYSGQQIESWDDYFLVESTILPITDIFDASDEFYEKIISFLNEENIQDFIAADYSLEWIYFFFFNYAGELDEDSASQLISIEKEYLDYYFEILKG